MTPRRRIAFACIAFPAAVELGLGVVYLAASEPMPYHREALGVAWSELTPGTRAVLRTLLNGYGSTHLATGVALGALLLLPFRRGEAWARWAVLAIGLPVLAGTALLSWRLARETGAGVPWQGAAALLALFVAGVALAGPERRRADPRKPGPPRAV